MARIRWPKVTRDVGLPLLGAGILVHQAIFAVERDPTLIYAAVALCFGTPLVARSEEKRKENGSNK